MVLFCIKFQSHIDPSLTHVYQSRAAIGRKYKADAWQATTHLEPIWYPQSKEAKMYVNAAFHAQGRLGN